MNCWFCQGAMIWGGDHDKEDYGCDEPGIVANLTCSECGAFCLFYSPGEEEKE